MAINHQSPYELIPALTTKQINTTTWGAGATTSTIVDAKIHLNSVVIAYITGSTPPAGFWAYTVTQGQVVITSSASETSSLPLSYIVI